MSDQPETDQPEFTPPEQTSNRDYEEPQPEPIPLYPMSPRERNLMEAFRETIRLYLAQPREFPLEFGGDATIGEFSDKLALELWRLTRDK